MLRIRARIDALFEARDSQYLNAYQSSAIERLKAGLRPLSIGTFLAYQLRGSAKHYGDLYARALRNSLERAGWLRGTATGLRSQLGSSDVYYPPMTPQNVALWAQITRARIPAASESLQTMPLQSRSYAGHAPG